MNNIGRSVMSGLNTFKGKLNKKIQYMTCPCIPHIPISQYMRENFMSRSTVFRLAAQKKISINRVGKRYYVANTDTKEQE